MMDSLYFFRLCVTLTLVVGILITIWGNYRLKTKIEKLRRDMDLHFDRYNEDIIKFGSSLKRMKNAGKALFKDRLIQSCRFFIEQEKSAILLRRISKICIAGIYLLFQMIYLSKDYTINACSFLL